MQLFAADEIVKTVTGLSRLQEYGLVGLLILAIIVCFGYLLRHVLNQAKEDRDLWLRQSEKFIESQERISTNMLAVTMTLKEVSMELKTLREKVEKLEDKHDAASYRSVGPAPLPRPAQRRNGGGPEST